MQTSLQPVPDRQDPLRKAAQQLEATFLAEMLKSAGLGESRESFGGGSGEDQFSTFLVRAQAEQMAQAGGIGLAESLYNSMKEAQND
ncbi:flagellar biosynthesis protein FlgJ [Rhodobacteraceae bacterium CY05]|uniref:Flagellar biosynthesis protein FlgJ n=2 Tax=Parasedimentitalea huanghaiensis TaxID=2682100 RepID=A0A6L6WG53_9RHOB|nr:rod-binding protein [Zongyanglinia huanghaiensis]MVO15585.1 flagellar biosynthesis protein FlgJ [Zongyanglinia huanghaiensis]